MAMFKSKITVLAITLFILLAQVATILAQEEEAMEATEGGIDGAGQFILIIGLIAVVAVGFVANVRESEAESDAE